MESLEKNRGGAIALPPGTDLLTLPAGEYTINFDFGKGADFKNYPNPVDTTCYLIVKEGNYIKSLTAYTGYINEYHRIISPWKDTGWKAIF